MSDINGALLDENELDGEIKPENSFELTANNVVTEIYTVGDENFITARMQPENTFQLDINNGMDGKSAYEIWLDHGNNGTEQDFLESLKQKDVNYIHDQIAAAVEWIIEHNLDKYPSVTIVDTGGNVVVGDIDYISRNQLKINFTYEFSGKAYLN